MQLYNCFKDKIDLKQFPYLQQMVRGCAIGVRLPKSKAVKKFDKIYRKLLVGNSEKHTPSISSNSSRSDSNFSLNNVEEFSNGTIQTQRVKASFNIRRGFGLSDNSVDALVSKNRDLLLQLDDVKTRTLRLIKSMSRSERPGREPSS